ncbi:trypsin-like serine protease [Kitasatospora sp. NPDC004289]
MRVGRRLTWPLVAALAVPLAVASVPATAADEVPPTVVEDYSYPGAAQILAERGITLKAGDGHFLLADCASGTGLVHVLSRALTPSEVCFKINGRDGRLVMEIPRVYQIKADDHAIKASLTADGTTKVVDLQKNFWNPVGEGSSGSESVLLELNATGDGPVGIGSPVSAQPAVTAVSIGKPGADGSRLCTGTVVDPQWVLTAKSCFADAPDTSAEVAAGAPKVRTTVSIDRLDVASPLVQEVEVIELVPRADRDVVLLKLAKAVTGVLPLTVSATAPAAGEVLKTAGYGRTKDRWLAGEMHTGQFSVDSAAATTLTASSVSGSTVCRGDAGGPVLREGNGAVQVVAVNTRSWQGGCLGVTETRTGVTQTRVDDLVSWFQQLGVQYAASGYTPVTATRVLDTRVVASTTWETDPAGGSALELKLGQAGTSPLKLPAGTTAAVLNVTVVNPASAGFVTVRSTRSARPGGSSVNFAAGQVVPNLVTAPVDIDGTVHLWGTTGNVNLVVDVLGYYSPQSTGRFTARTPARLIDTRDRATPIGAYSTLDVQVGGLNGVPATATAVVLNLTVTNPAAVGNLTVFPAGATRPATSNLNYSAGQTIANQVIVPVGANGKVSVYSQSGGTTDLIVDFVGDYSPTGAGLYRPIAPLRVLDTRLNGGAPLSAGQVVAVKGTPPGAKASVLNVTAVNPESPGFFALAPSGAARPATSNLNFAVGAVLAGQAMVSNGDPVPASQNDIALHVAGGGKVHAVADLSGYFTTAK